jgi:hypothetical protein
MTSDEKRTLALSVGSVAAFLLGFRRLAGAIAIGQSYFAYRNKHYHSAAFSGLLGTAFLVRPSWPDEVGDALKTALGGNKPAALPPPEPAGDWVNYKRTSATQGGDELLAGNWTLFDMSDAQSSEVAAHAKTMKPGEVAALVLAKPNGSPLVFRARVVRESSPTPGRYTGQWITQKPVNGPEFAEFGPNHVLAITY